MDDWGFPWVKEVGFRKAPASDILVENLTARHTGVGMNFKSGLTRGGYVRDIYIRNVNLSEVGKVIDFDLNWFPESMVKLPESFLGKPIPEHWKVMTRPVIPPERGIPVFSDLHFRDITGDKCRIALSGNASTQIPLRNLTFERCRISAKAETPDMRKMSVSSAPNLSVRRFPADGIKDASGLRKNWGPEFENSFFYAIVR